MFRGPYILRMHWHFDIDVGYREEIDNLSFTQLEVF